MISSIQIRNYRRHRKFDIKLNRITVLRGASGTGKTSAMGALKLVAFNQPSGTSYISWNKKQTAVRITVDRHKITRRRSLTENTYTIDGKKLKAFGTGVPKAVSDKLKLTRLNFHRQHDSPFWFGETAGEVSRQLNKIVNLDLIDRTLSSLDSQKREITSRIKDTKERLQKATKTKDHLSFVPDMLRDLRGLEKKEQRKEEIALKSRRIHDLLKGAVRYHQIAKRSQNRATGARTLLNKAETWEKLGGKRDRLVGLLWRIDKVQDVATRPIPDINSIIEKKSRWEETAVHLNRIKNLLSKIEQYRGDKIYYEKRERELKKEFDKKIGKVCPLCQNKIA